MTARQVYEGVLVELNKVQAPSLLLEDFNYLFNKAINQYTNKRYNIYDINQQTTDDLRVLKSSVVLRADNTVGPVSDVTTRDSMWGAIYEFSMPKDYLHILNCICNFKVNKPFKCYDAGTYVQFGATRLTADLWSQIINNFYMRPTYKRPYYYIHNVNQDLNGKPIGTKEYAEGAFGRVPSDNINIPTDPGNIDIQQLKILGDPKTLYDTTYIDDSNQYDFKKYGIPRTFILEGMTSGKFVRGNTTYGSFIIPTAEYVSGDPTKNAQVFLEEGISVKDNQGKEITNPNDIVRDYSYYNWYNGDSVVLTPAIVINEKSYIDKVERAGEVRYGNNSNVRLEIRYGKDNSLFTLDSVYIDYIKAPQWIRLTQEQLDLTEDTSQMMEFPDYICQEIINELVHLVMENSADSRLQTHPVVTQSIAQPAQQLEQANQ